MPLAHPAHVLNPGKVSAGAGIAATVVPSQEGALSASAVRLQDLAIAPQTSPWIGARVGLGNGFECGISASSRAVRLDGRRAFLWVDRTVALSIGLGARALLAAAPMGSASGVVGGGVDVPVIVGWHSSADIYSAWIGPRFGVDMFSGRFERDAGSGQADGQLVSAGGVFGVRAGLRHVFGVLELDAAYHLATGTLSGEALRLTGWTVAPFGGLVVSF